MVHSEVYFIIILFSVIYASLFFTVHFVETFQRLKKIFQFLKIFTTPIQQCSEFTWLLLFSKVSAQYIILVKFFPPSLPLETRFGNFFVLCHQIKLGTLFSSAVKSAQRIPQACWPCCRLISPADQYSSPIQNLLLRIAFSS